MASGNFTKERSVKHGLCGHQLYKMWDQIKQGCTNRKSARWVSLGSNGIKFYSPWSKDFIEFYNWAMANGWKQYYRIGRIDIEKDFTPENSIVIEGKKRVSRMESSVRSHRKKKSDDFDW